MSKGEYDKVSDTGKRYYTEERNGETIRIYESGAEYNEDRKHLVNAPPDKRICNANAKMFADRRWSQAEEAARQGMVAAAQMLEEGIEDPDAAWSTMVGAQTMLALNPDSGRASTEAFKAVGRATGYMKDARQTSLQLSNDGRSLRVDGLPTDRLLLLLDRLGGDKSTYRSLDQQTEEDTSPPVIDARPAGE